MSRYPIFDRQAIKFKSVNERTSKIDIRKAAKPTMCQQSYDHIPEEMRISIEKLSNKMAAAMLDNKPIILCMGAHSIKNGACLLINDLITSGRITHVASNGAAAIHDWEFAKFGRSTECVRTNVSKGEFGIWNETGKFFGMAAECAISEGVGWGEKIGELMHNSIDFDTNSYDAIDYSVMEHCYHQEVPFTIHPGIGQDIIYSHPALNQNVGSCILDFEIFCEAIRNIEGGIYLSVGSSVMSPMIFEKALSMARNVEMQADRRIDNFLMAVNDLADSNWDWSQGEPPMDNPAYYLRFMKSFHRMGGELEYYGINNVDFLDYLHYCIFN